MAKTEPLEGAPAGAPARYDGQERHTDGDLKVKEWTPALAKQIIQGAYGFSSERAVQVARFRRARRAGLLPAEAIKALVKAGWKELA